MVYVLTHTGEPLMPTERHGKVRRLLKQGKAKVINLCPFVIQLNYDSATNKQDVVLGVDAGSKHVGLSACSEHRELFSAEMQPRNDVTKKNIRQKRIARG